MRYYERGQEGPQRPDPKAPSIESVEVSKLSTVTWPSELIAVRTARKTSKIIMAYSTVVGPSSSMRKRTSLFNRSFIDSVALGDNRGVDGEEREGGLPAPAPASPLL